MAYTLDNLRTDIRNYTEVGSNVLSDTVLERIIKNAELKIHRAIDTDQSVFYATSNLIINNRYVTIPADLRFIRYVQLKDTEGNQFYLEQRDTSFMAEYYSTPGTSAGPAGSDLIEQPKLKNLQAFASIPSFDAISVNDATGYTIQLGQIDSAGNVTGATTTDPLTDPINYFYIAFDLSVAGTVGGISGGGENCSAGPVTLEVVNG